MSLHPLFALVRKDLRIFLKDRRAVILSFAAPIMLAALFTLISGGGGGGDSGAASAIDIVVADEDDSPLSREIVKGLESDKNLDVSRETRDKARAQVAKGDIGVAVAIPKGFGEKATTAMFRGEGRPEITFLSDPTHAAEAGMVRGLMTQHVMQAVSRDAFGGQGGRQSLKTAIDALDQPDSSASPQLKTALRSMYRDILALQEADTETAGNGKEGQAKSRRYSGFSSPFEVREEVVSAEGQVSRGIAAAHAFSGMSVQFILFAAIEAGVGLLMERQKGLWRRLRVAPLSRFTLLASKAISQALIGLLIVLVVFGVGVMFFGLRFSGNFPGFVLVAFAYSLAASAFGLLVAALGKTPQAARGISVMAVLVMVLLGGAWMPTFLFPAWLQKVTPIIPTRWAVDGFEGATWRGLGFLQLMPSVAALLGFAAVFGLLALARFRWEGD